MSDGKDDDDPGRTPGRFVIHVNKTNAKGGVRIYIEMVDLMLQWDDGNPAKADDVIREVLDYLPKAIQAVRDERTVLRVSSEIDADLLALLGDDEDEDSDE